MCKWYRNSQWIELILLWRNSWKYVLHKQGNKIWPHLTYYNLTTQEGLCNFCHNISHGNYEHRYRSPEELAFLIPKEIKLSIFNRTSWSSDQSPGEETSLAIRLNRQSNILKFSIVLTRAVRDCLICPFASISECLVSWLCLGYEHEIGRRVPNLKALYNFWGHKWRKITLTHSWL